MPLSSGSTAPDPHTFTPPLPGAVAGAGSGSHGEATRTARLLRRPGTPKAIAYLMAPAGLVAIVTLMYFNLVAKEPILLWCIVLCLVPMSSLAADLLYGQHPTELRLHLRIATQAAGLTAVIYLTGWGSVLVGAFAFLALENMSSLGSQIWRVTALWSVVGIAAGQLAITEGWMPSQLSHTDDLALAIMGGFILLFVIRLAAAAMKQKEDAEAAMKLSEDRFRSLIQNASDATLVVDRLGYYTYVSPTITTILGRTSSSLVGLHSNRCVHPDDADRVQARLASQFDSDHSRALIQFRMERQNGTWCDVEAVVSNQLDRPAVAGYVVNLRDVTERKEFEALLSHRALHDPLTGLANRQLILDRAEQMLVRARRAGHEVIAYFIDLDNFKDANDSLGHEAGDRLLQAVSRRFDALLRASDTVGRLGGDEFVILTEGTSPTTDPLTVADRIREVLRDPFSLEGFEELPITVSASIGVAVGDRTSAQELLRDADIALYRAKASGRDRCVLFEPAMQSAVLDRLELKSDLDSALAGDQYFLLYQPIFDLRHTQIRGVEALIRWRHPVRGVIAPDEFIPTLEDSRLIVDVGRWVLQEACAQGARWLAAGHRIGMAVNVSMRQLETPVLVEHVKEALAMSGFDPSLLTIEVTESAIMRDAEATVARLKELKDLGILIAIDDFGTGYASMSYLRQFPVDILKIDRSFISEVDETESSAVLVHTLVELGRTLGLTTLAEGIEHDAQLEALRSEQCDHGQGFIFSRPVPAVDVEAMLTTPAAARALQFDPAPGATPRAADEPAATVARSPVG